MRIFPFRALSSKRWAAYVLEWPDVAAATAATAAGGAASSSQSRTRLPQPTLLELLPSGTAPAALDWAHNYVQRVARPGATRREVWRADAGHDLLFFRAMLGCAPLRARLRKASGGPQPTAEEEGAWVAAVTNVLRRVVDAVGAGDVADVEAALRESDPGLLRELLGLFASEVPVAEVAASPTAAPTTAGAQQKEEEIPPPPTPPPTQTASERPRRAAAAEVEVSPAVMAPAAPSPRPALACCRVFCTLPKPVSTL